MKRILVDLIAIILIVATGIITSCETTEEISAPDVSFTAEPTTLVAGQTVTFEVIGEADNLVIWTGDEGHDYSKRTPQMSDTVYIEKDEGKALREPTYNYTYRDAGTFTATLIASNVGNYGETIEQTIKELVINVETAPEEEE